jgi:hypothetical protein
MDAGAFQVIELGITLLSVGGGAALWLWSNGKAKGRHEALVAALDKQRAEDQPMLFRILEFPSTIANTLLVQVTMSVANSGNSTTGQLLKAVVF